MAPVIQENMAQVEIVVCSRWAVDLDTCNIVSDIYIYILRETVKRDKLTAKYALPRLKREMGVIPDRFSIITTFSI